MKKVADNGLALTRQEFSVDAIDVEELEWEVEFWTKVDECEFCTDSQICTSHYGLLVGYG